jgi:hypothetical protein
MNNHHEFLNYVQSYVAQNPDVAPLITQHIIDGIVESRKQILERAADMETALAVAVAQRYQQRDSLIFSMLKKWNGKTSLRWDGVIEYLEAKVKV